MFKKIVVFVILFLLVIPQFALAGTPGDKLILPAPKLPETQPIQPPVPVPPAEPSPPPPTPLKPKLIDFYLTFDDGPNPQYTPQVLALLDKFGARGTFFMVGTNVIEYPEIVQQALLSDNEVAAHTMTHPYPDDFSDSRLDYEITRSVTILRETSGKSVHYFRPPYGRRNYIYSQRAPELGVKIIYWTVDPRDWSGISSDTIAERVLDNLQPGSIVLMHDGGGDRQETVNALEIILREAKARGYNSVSLSELEK
ncbi:MAG: polysaccharide deacetylase family protein [Sporomusaceae bacterium]|nr:polysaccharide deacetylase family protein [Sporomusaceae bacterium]